MNLLERLYPGDDAAVLAASVLVQVAGVVLAGYAATGTFARRNAALRQAVWLAVLAWVCVAPAAAWGLQRTGVVVWRVSAPILVQTPTRETHGAADHAMIPPSQQSAKMLPPTSPSGDAAAEVGSRPPRTAEAWPGEDIPVPGLAPVGPLGSWGRPVRSIIAAMFIVWAAGAAVLLARVAWGLYFIVRIRRELMPAGDFAHAACDRVRRTLGVPALPAITLSRRIRGPATIGLGRPVVVLPAELLPVLSDEELHDVLAHECTHALCRHGSVALAQRIVGAVYWAHPLIHLLSRELTRSREEVCDNAVLQGSSAAGYARTLLSLAQTIQATAAGASFVGFLDGRWRLERRVAGLLNSRRIAMTRISVRAAVALTGIFFALGTGLAAVGRAQDAPTRPAAPQPATPARPTDGDTSARGEAPKAQSDTPAPRLLTTAETESRKKLEQARRDVRRAELDVREAELKLQGDQATLQRLLDSKGVATSGDVDRAKLTVDLDRIQLERAMLTLDDVRQKPESLFPPVRLVVFGPSLGSDEKYPIGLLQLTVSQIVAQHPSVDAAHAKSIEVVLERRSGNDRTMPRSTLQDLTSGTAKDEVVQPGDAIYVRLLAAMVRDHTGSDRGKMIWLNGRTVTAQQLLTEAGVNLNKVGVRRVRFSSRSDKKELKGWNDTFDVAEVLTGGRKGLLDDAVEPGDFIEVFGGESN